MTTLCGFLCIDKAPDLSSFATVKHIRKLLPSKTKIGHAGTLDVFAQGLLIVGIGRRATRYLTQISSWPKTYRAHAQLGLKTDTLDHTGATLIAEETTTITTQDLQTAIDQFRGEYQQIPPIYSALKHKGVPLYALARHQEVSSERLQRISESKARTATIYSCALDTYTAPYFSFTAQVSKGTYIRTLANDIAQGVGTVATTTKLVRTNIGGISLDMAHSLETLCTYEAIAKKIISHEMIYALHDAYDKKNQT